MGSNTSVALEIISVLLFALPATCLGVWKLSKSLAYRLSKNEDNVWIAVPSFVVMLVLLALAGGAIDGALSPAHPDPNGSPPNFIEIWLFGCLAAAAIAAAVAILRAVLFVIGGAFGSVEKAVRGKE